MDLTFLQLEFPIVFLWISIDMGCEKEAKDGKLLFLRVIFRPSFISHSKMATLKALIAAE